MRLKLSSQFENDCEQKLVCLWDDCNHEVTGSGYLSTHIDEVHLSSCANEDLVCKWFNCYHTCLDAQNLRRHVLFHVFHESLKLKGFYALNSASNPEGLACTIDSLKSHLVPALEEPFVCEWEGCGESFDLVDVFYRHVEYHVSDCRNNGSLHEECHWRGCTVGSVVRIKNHVLAHACFKSIACYQCGSMFSCRRHFFMHLQSQKPKEKCTHVCSFCSRRFATKTLLSNHFHSHISKFRCSVCGITFPKQSMLNIHMIRHMEDRSHICTECGASFKHPSLLASHVKIVHNPVIHICPHEGCDYKSKHNYILRRHIQKMHENVTHARYLCDLCPRTYSRGYTLSKHLREAHQLSYPQGHMRFQFRLADDGCFHLLRHRCELLTVSKHVLTVPPSNMAASTQAPSTSGAKQEFEDHEKQEEKWDEWGEDGGEGCVVNIEPERADQILALTCHNSDGPPESFLTEEGQEVRLPECVRERLRCVGTQVLVTVDATGNVCLLDGATLHTDMICVSPEHVS